jgi:hypothetical protein
MDITVYIKNNDLDSMISFYKRTNNNEQFKIEDIPNVEIFEQKPKTGKFIEMHLYYDIYQGMKYALSKTKQAEHVDKITTEIGTEVGSKIATEIMQTTDMLKKSENLNMQNEVVYTALMEMKKDQKLSPSEAMNNSLVEWDIK